MSAISGLRTALVTAALSLLIAPTTVHGQSQFDDVELVVGRHGGRFLVRVEGFDVERGRLTSDVSARLLRFERRGEVLLEVAFDRLAAVHYEESRYLRRGLRGTTPLLVVHYVNAAGEPAFAILRPARDSAPSLLEALERDTGRRVERNAERASFAGLAIHLAPGLPVYVTDSAGQRTRGEVSSVALSSVELGPASRYDAASVRQIDVIDPIWDGVATGMAFFFIPGGLLSVDQCWERCQSFAGLSGGGWGVIAAGGVVGALIDRQKMRNAYRRPEAGAASTRVEWTPVFDYTRKAFQLSIRF